MSHNHKHNECDDNSCGPHSHEDSCCSHHHHKDDDCCHEDFAKELLKVADCAWMELLKEKIKKEIETNCGEQLAQIAKVVADTNGSRWEHKLALTKTQSDYKEKLKNIFCCNTGSCCK